MQNPEPDTFGGFLLRAGKSTQRLGDCASYAIPPSFAQYLNTSFLGERQSIEVGPVNYSYYQFGPLNAGATGIYSHVSRCEQRI